MEQKPRSPGTSAAVRVAQGLWIARRQGVHGRAVRTCGGGVCPPSPDLGLSVSVLKYKAPWWRGSLSGWLEMGEHPGVGMLAEKSTLVLHSQSGG